MSDELYNVPSNSMKAREEEKAGHVKSIDHLLGIRVKFLYIYQVKGYHQQNKYTFQIVYFTDPLSRLIRFHYLLIFTTDPTAESPDLT